MTGLTQVQSSIQPRQPLSPALTRRTQNQGMIDIIRGSQPDTMLDRMPMNRGFSRGAGNFRQIMPGLAAAQSARNALPANIALQDAVTNAGMLRQGQVARERESLGNAQLAASMADLGRARQMQGLPLLQMLLGAM